MKPCPNCGEECVGGESIIAEVPIQGPSESVGGSEGYYRLYESMGVYYRHSSGKICVKETAKVVKLEEPILRTLKDVHK